MHCSILLVTPHPPCQISPSISHFTLFVKIHPLSKSNSTCQTSPSLQHSTDLMTNQHHIQVPHSRSHSNLPFLFHSSCHIQVYLLEPSRLPQSACIVSLYCSTWLPQPRIHLPCKGSLSSRPAVQQLCLLPLSSHKHMHAWNLFPTLAPLCQRHIYNPLPPIYSPLRCFPIQDSEP